MALEKGRFYNADTGAEVVACQFNPETLQISRANKWDPAITSGSRVSDMTFAGTQPQQLVLNLLFDTYETRTDVQTKTKLLLGLMDIPSGTNQARPPHVEFGWGQYRSFRGVITNFSQTFSMFLETGVPVRAKVSVTLNEVPRQAAAARSGGQNPTSRQTGARRVRTIQPGDTLDYIAFQELGDSNKWRQLAETNRIEDPRRLPAGFQLYIPSEN
jgi:hypothetical protein